MLVALRLCLLFNEQGNRRIYNVVVLKHNLDTGLAEILGTEHWNKEILGSLVQ